MDGKKPKLAWCLIVRGVDNEALLLDECLRSLRGHVDGLYIDINSPVGKEHSKKVIKVAKKYNADITLTVWNDNFAEARNANFSRVPKEYTFIGWCDADDVIKNPSKIKDVIRIADKQPVDGIMVKYNYDVDEFGNVTTVHTNLRLIKNNGAFEWQGRLHETLVDTRRADRKSVV